MKLPPIKVLYRNQIELRLLSPRDGAAIFAGVRDSLPELRRFMSWAHYGGDLAQACSIYTDFEAKSLKGEESHFAGFDANTGDFLFCASLVAGSRLNPSAYDVGYWVSTKHTGKGLGTIAAQMLVILAFQYYAAERLSIVCNPDNLGSLRIIEKCGFHFEGRLRNFLAKPSEKIISQGYSQMTDVACFSLIPPDISSLIWYENTSANLLITPFFEANAQRAPNLDLPSLRPRIESYS